jgi:hypothetical protein
LDLNILLVFKQILGFGQIFVKSSKLQSHQLRVGNKQDLWILIDIFNGNIVLEKVQRRFELFVNQFNKYYNESVRIK